MVVIIFQYRNESKQPIVQLKPTQCSISIILHKAGEKQIILVTGKKGETEQLRGYSYVPDGK